MAEPKKRNNKSRRGTRRRNIKEVLPKVIYCSNCHEATLPHKICKNCGYYGGKLIIEKPEKVSEDLEGGKEDVKIKKK